ncbi:hypothetical protein LX36DRAFT_698666 [Colletotrichum falcatum]|nr:hypothetical protein LX36DRAFT_698666 [Colletotrichum falcatum]
MESGNRPPDPSLVTMHQQELQTWVYKPLRDDAWTATILIFVLLAFLGVTFTCTLAFLSAQQSLPIAWAVLAALGAAVLALLSLLGTLRWWHHARPHLPQPPVNQNGSCSDVSDVNLREALKTNAADTPAKIRFVVTWTSYQIVRVADMIFGRRVPPHPIPYTPLGEPGAGQRSGCDANVGTSRPREEGGGEHQDLDAKVVIAPIEVETTLNAIRVYRAPNNVCDAALVVGKRD